MIYDNAYLFDWLTVSFDDDTDYMEIIDMIGMRGKSWQDQQSGSRLRYGHRLSFDGISVHYTDSTDVKHNCGCCLEMSGQGCRDFESFGSGDWLGLFALISESHGKITRLDIAYDDFTGVLPIDIIADMARSGQYVSRLQRCLIVQDWDNHTEHGRCGLTILHGSRSSDTSIRIYDKRAERKAWDIPHWVRCEIQLRSGCGQGFLDRFQDCGSLGEAFSGVVANYLLYKCRSSDSNLRRAATAPFWLRFLGAADALAVHDVRGVEYNKSNLDAHIDRNHNAIKTAILTNGLREFVEQAFGHSQPLPDRYARIIQADRNGDQILDILRSTPVEQVRAVLDSV